MTVTDHPHRGGAPWPHDPGRPRPCNGHQRGRGRRARPRGGESRERRPRPLLKPHLYAEAGIRWYLRVEQEGPVGHLHELVDGAYREVARGAVVEIAEQFPATLDLPHLAR